MEEIDQAKDQGKYKKRLWDDLGKKQNQEQLKMNNGKGKYT